MSLDSIPGDAYSYMSNHRRQKLDLDYEILHRTGRRVPKVRGSKMTDFEVQIININSDIEDLYESYQLEDLASKGEIVKFVSKIGEIKQEYRRIYAHLKKTEGGNFDRKFPEYSVTQKELNNKFKAANDKLNKFENEEKQKKDEFEQTRAALEAERLKKEIETINCQAQERKAHCKFERKYYVDQVKWEIQDCAWEKICEIEDVTRLISSFESRLDKLYAICSNYKVILGEESELLGFHDEDEKLITSIRTKIRDGRITLDALKEKKEIKAQESFQKNLREKEMAEQKRLKQDQEEEQNKIDNLLSCAENLHAEIESRYDALYAKCTIDINKLNDYEVLDLKKREDNIYTELRELIDKMSSFETFVLPCGDSASLLRKSVSTMRSSSTSITDVFVKSVGKAMLDRDISEKKLKNAAGLNIKLTKFVGYNSEIDIYTFRTEFSKLIEPNVQRCLWSDYLKKNCLGGAAHNLVAKEESINEIWKKLFQVYGDTNLIFQNKISALDKYSNFGKLKDDAKIAYAISSLLNVMVDLQKLATEYDLLGELYYGGGLQKILDLMGCNRERKFLKSIASCEKLKAPEKWRKLMDFLKVELKERETFILNDKIKKSMILDKSSRNPEQTSNKEGSIVFLGDQARSKDNCICHICGENQNHVLSLDGDGKSCIDYVACKTFVSLQPRDRDKLLYKKRLCSKCLTPGVKWNSEHNCNKTYSCNQKYTNKKGEGSICEKHVLVCGYHANEKGNKDLLERYKKNLFKSNNKFLEFSKAVTISCFSESYSNLEKNIEDSSIYAFQTIMVDDIKVNLFFDTGCGDMIVSKECVDKLMEKGLAKLEFDGPLTLNGVGNQQSICQHGAYSITLPSESGSMAKMSGLCVDSITVPFPKYPLKKVEKDFRNEISKSNPDILPSLPRLPSHVGGKVDVMLGKQYLKYFPKEIAKLESGLTLYKSCFKSPDGSLGVIAGPHTEFTKTERLAHFVHNKTYSYYSKDVVLYNKYIALANEVPLLGNKELPNQRMSDSDLRSLSLGYNDVGDSEFSLSENKEFNACTSRQPKLLKTFGKIESTGTNVSYRCMGCRNCVECKKGAFIEEISIQEEAEQHLINNCVSVDLENRTCTAKLPFLVNPDIRLVNNFNSALKVYNSQVRKLAKST